jgi:hypothetical protein
MQKWGYRYFDGRFNNVKSINGHPVEDEDIDLALALQYYGREGWELVSVLLVAETAGKFVFKRPLQEG